MNGKRTQSKLTKKIVLQFDLNGNFIKEWESVTAKAREVINGNIIFVTANNVDRLKNCYVFNGYYGVEEKINELRSRYKGKIYDYWEYEKILKQEKVK